MSDSSSEEYNDISHRDGMFLGTYPYSHDAPLSYLENAYERCGFNSVGMAHSVSSVSNSLLPIEIKNPEVRPQYWYRAGSPTQRPIYFQNMIREPSPEPLSSVCCGKKDSLLSMLIRCLVPCRFAKRDR